MKTVASFSDSYEALIAQGLLESEGINAEIMNDSTAFPGLGGIKSFEIKLVVSDQDYELASKILAASSREE